MLPKFLLEIKYNSAGFPGALGEGRRKSESRRRGEEEGGKEGGEEGVYSAEVHPYLSTRRAMPPGPSPPTSLAAGPHLLTLGRTQQPDPKTPIQYLVIPFSKL